MKKIIWGLIAAVVVVGGVYWAVSRSSVPDSALNGEEVVQDDAETAAQVKLDQQAVSSEMKAQRYTHPRLGFSFDKPAGYTVGALRDDNGETLLIQSATKAADQGFQIYITPADEAIELTPTRIHQDLPDTLVKNPQKINLDGAAGIMFESNNEAFGGKSFELWFYHAGSLYQATSYVGAASQMQATMGTWKF